MHGAARLKHNGLVVAPGENNMIWVSDGQDKLAVVTLRRAFKYYKAGIASRCKRVTESYLQNGFVPIPEGAECINIGANVGEVARELAHRGMRVLAVEPDPYVLPALRANTENIAGIDIVTAAAWKRDGPLDMHLSTSGADTSAFTPTGSRITVQGVTLDTLTKGMGHIGLICGDAEGAEPEVLEGASDTLRRTRYVSLRCSAERNGERTQAACEAILKKHNFEIIYKEDQRFCTLIGRNRDDALG